MLTILLGSISSSPTNPLPTPKEIFAKLSQYRIFNKIDLSDAFLQVELDNAKKLLTINTPCGLFQVNRLQPGIKTTSEAFQLIDTMSGARGTFLFIDDFIVGRVNVGRGPLQELFRSPATHGPGPRIPSQT